MDLFSARLPKLPSRVEIEQIGEFFFENLLQFFIIFCLWLKIYDLCRKNFDRSVKTAFSASAGFFDVPVISFWQCCRKCIQLVQWNFLGGFFETTAISQKSWTLSTFFSAFRQKFRQHCPNCHLRVLRNILKKKSSSKPEIFRSSSNLENETLGFLVENFQQAFQNWFLQIKWKILRIFSKQVEFSIYFLTFSFFFL